VGKRILVVEDDPAIGPMIAQILQLEGYTSTVVTEGRKVMDVLRSESFDAAILDVMLPGLDGISVMKAIRDEPATADLIVIMLTAKADDASTWAGWRAGCNYYMTKPFEPDELLAILHGIESASRV